MLLKRHRGIALLLALLIATAIPVCAMPVGISFEIPLWRPIFQISAATAEEQAAAQAPEGEATDRNISAQRKTKRETAIYSDAEKTEKIGWLRANTPVTVYFITGGMAYTSRGYIPYIALTTGK